MMNKNQEADKTSGIGKVILEEFLQYFFANPIKATLGGALFFGGVQLLIYFIYIDFMPDMTLESIASLMIAASALGLYGLFFITSAFALPGLTLNLITRTKTNDFASSHLLIISLSAALISASLFHALKYEYLTWLFAGIMLLVAPSLGIWANRKQIANKVACAVDSTNICPNTPTLPLQNWRKTWLRSAAATFALALLFCLPLGFFSILSERNYINTVLTGQIDYIFLLFALLMAVLTAGMAASNPSHPSPFKKALLIGPILLFFTLVDTGSFSFFLSIPIKILGQGEIGIARIAVTGATCNEINEAIGQRVCKAVKNDEVTAICPVTIRSRIGSQAVLEFPLMKEEIDQMNQPGTALTYTNGALNGRTGQNLVHRAIIDKTKLLSWQPLLNGGKQAMLNCPRILPHQR